MFLTALLRLEHVLLLMRAQPCVLFATVAEVLTLGCSVVVWRVLQRTNERIRVVDGIPESNRKTNTNDHDGATTAISNGGSLLIEILLLFLRLFRFFDQNVLCCSAKTVRAEFPLRRFFGPGHQLVSKALSKIYLSELCIFNMDLHKQKADIQIHEASDTTGDKNIAARKSLPESSQRPKTMKRIVWASAPDFRQASMQTSQTPSAKARSRAASIAAPAQPKDRSQPATRGRIARVAASIAAARAFESQPSVPAPIRAARKSSSTATHEATGTPSPTTKPTTPGSPSDNSDALDVLDTDVLEDSKLLLQRQSEATPEPARVRAGSTDPVSRLSVGPILSQSSGLAAFLAGV
jgi:hypothetical protein